MKDRARELIEEKLTVAIRYERAFADAAGGVVPGLFLSQVWYWALRTTDREGWFYKTTGEWTEETGLTRSELETARQRLQTLEILTTERRGLKGRLHYKLNTRKLYELLSVFGKPENRKPENRAIPESENLQTEMPKTCKQTDPVCGKPANQFAGNLQTLHTANTTTEITDSFPRASRLKKDWTLPDEWRQEASAIRGDVNFDYEADKFKDFWVGKAGRDAAKMDWRATWRNWIRNAKPSPKSASRDGISRNGTSTAATMEDLVQAELEGIERRLGRDTSNAG